MVPKLCFGNVIDTHLLNLSRFLTKMLMAVAASPSMTCNVLVVMVLIRNIYNLLFCVFEYLKVSLHVIWQKWLIGTEI